MKINDEIQLSAEMSFYIYTKKLLDWNENPEIENGELLHSSPYEPIAKAVNDITEFSINKFITNGSRLMMACSRQHVLLLFLGEISPCTYIGD